MKLPSDRTLEKYGLSAWQYMDLWNLAGGRCPLCSKRFSLTRPAVIDHDHRTHTVRGLLCQHCNLRVGELHENVGWLENAARYLRCPATYQLWGAEGAPRLKQSPPRHGE